MVRGYARVSSKGQEKYGNGLETQTAELKAAGAEIIYTDAYTGAKCSRPNFDKLLAELEPNDTLMVTKLDRFARSITQGNEIITQLIDKGIKVHILNMALHQREFFAADTTLSIHFEQRFFASFNQQKIHHIK